MVFSCIVLPVHLPTSPPFALKVLKLYAWEPSFIQEVGSIRKKELSYLSKFLYLDCSITFIFACIPTLVALATFSAYILSSSENLLTAEKAFVSLSLLNILRFPLFMFPTLLSNIVQVSLILCGRFVFLLAATHQGKYEDINSEW
ncbi:unnamed protein product [Taenia asiatica]|uniref:ABC transmembrane type-1 domain-containing protein n=1 Tax=Taenia asiatica TaxID=60517 RepID=A0A0R3VVG0_TAEAS|nr:unnamed protein product [Taenia asiatica]